MITIQDILDIDNCEIYFFDHYKQEHPEGKHLYWGELSLVQKSTPEGIQEYFNSDVDVYLIPDYLHYGDYDNSCMVERSNYKIFLEEYKDETGVFTISGGYGSSGIAISIKWLLDPDNEEKAQSIIDLLNGLNGYPCIDDEDLSNMEYEAFYESLKDYGIDDTCRELSKKYGITVHDYNREKLEGMILDIDGNGNPVFMIESGGLCYIDIDDMIVPKISRDMFISALIDYEVVPE